MYSHSIYVRADMASSSAVVAADRLAWFLSTSARNPRREHRPAGGQCTLESFHCRFCDPRPIPYCPVDVGNMHAEQVIKCRADMSRVSWIRRSCTDLTAQHHSWLRKLSVESLPNVPLSQKACQRHGAPRLPRVTCGISNGQASKSAILSKNRTPEPDNRPVPSTSRIGIAVCATPSLVRPGGVR
jgi:hypothetical protein